MSYLKLKRLLKEKKKTEFNINLLTHLSRNAVAGSDTVDIWMPESRMCYNLQNLEELKKNINSILTFNKQSMENRLLKIDDIALVETLSIFNDLFQQLENLITEIFKAYTKNDILINYNTQVNNLLISDKDEYIHLFPMESYGDEYKKNGKGFIYKIKLLKNKYKIEVDPSKCIYSYDNNTNLSTMVAVQTDKVEKDKVIIIRLNSVPHMFYNYGGSNTFDKENTLLKVIEEEEGIKRSNISVLKGFNHFHYLDILNKLIIIFVANSSNKFRVYAVINNQRIKYHDGILIEPINMTDAGINDDGLLAEIKYKSTTMLDKQNTIKLKSSDDNKWYGTVDKVENYLHNLFLNSNKEAIDSFMGYSQEYQVFTVKDPGDKNDSKIMRIDKFKCKDMIQKYIRKPLINKLEDLNKWADKLEAGASITIDDYFEGAAGTSEVDMTNGADDNVVNNIYTENTTDLTKDILKKIYEYNISLRDPTTKFGINDYIYYVDDAGITPSIAFKNSIKISNDDQKLDRVAKATNTNNTEQYTEIKFENVFYLNEPESLGSEMDLNAKMSLGTGVMLVTQGYSGTGKSFALFGSKDNGTMGMVETVLTELSSRAYYMRIYEVYGHAVPYDFYFQESPQIILIEHKFNDNLTWEDKIIHYKDDEIKEYMDKFTDISKYTQINPGSSEGIDVLMDSIEEKRKEGYALNDDSLHHSFIFKTVKATLNNPESSRSIIYIDLKVKVGTDYVPLVLCDMPGRENLKTSYSHHFEMIPPTVSTIAATIAATIPSFYNNYNPDFILETLLWNPVALFSLTAVRNRLMAIIKGKAKDPVMQDIIKTCAQEMVTPFQKEWMWIDRANNPPGPGLYGMFFLPIVGLHHKHGGNESISRKLNDGKISEKLGRASQIKDKINDLDVEAMINNMPDILDNNINYINNEYSNIGRDIKMINMFDSQIMFNVLGSFYLFSSIMKHKDYINKFNILFDLIKVAVDELTNNNILNYIGINMVDDIMKSYEGIYINENINAIMMTLLKEHDRSKDLNWLIDTDTKSSSVITQHGQFSLSDLMENYIRHIYNISEDNLSELKESNGINLFKYFATDNSDISIEYDANKIFYIGKDTTNQTYDVNRPGGTVPSDKNKIETVVDPILHNYLNTKKVGFPRCSDFAFLLVTTNLLNATKCNEQTKLLENMQNFITAVSEET